MYYWTVTDNQMEYLTVMAHEQQNDVSVIAGHYKKV
jgi:hypothetical protein